MNAHRAHEFGVNHLDVRITSEVDRYSGKWVAWVPDDLRESGRAVLTESHDLYSVCSWWGTLRTLNLSDR